MYLNKVFLYGNLTRDPEVRALPNGGQVASFGLATNRSYKDKTGAKQEQTEFHNVVAFGKLADIIAQYVKKGRPLFVEGRIQTRSWDDKETGAKKYRTEIVMENFQFGADGGRGASAPGNTRGADTGAPSAMAPAASSEEDGDIKYPNEEINLDDIPF